MKDVTTHCQQPTPLCCTYQYHQWTPYTFTDIYAHTVLIEDKQFLLLIDIPIQDS